MLLTGQATAPLKTAPSIRGRLREAILRDHEYAEQLVEKLDIFTDKNAYGYWLNAMFDVHHLFSICLDEASFELGLEPCHELLSRALQDDIAAQDLPMPDILTEPLQPNAPEQRFGPAYVLEGSGLGARVLVKRATASQYSNISYIDTLQAISKQRWPIFVGALEDEPLSFEPTAKAAKSVFEVLIAKLEMYPA